MKKLSLITLLLSITFLSQAQEFRFALISDTHVRANDSLAFNDLKKAIDQINNTKGLDFVIVSGDITEEGDKASLLKAKQLFDKLNVKYYILSGNHETKWSESGSTDFGHIFGSEKFEFQHKGFRFLGFATGPVIRMMDGHVAPQDIDWLDSELKKNPRQPTILVTHYPLLPSDVDNWYELTDVVRKYDIKAVLGGHYHSNKLVLYDGIPGIINRSCLRDKEDKIGGYTIYDITSDSIKVAEQKIGQTLRPWGGYSLKEEYYTADNTGYTRPSYSVNEEYANVSRAWESTLGKAIYASPVVSANKVYVGDDDGVFHCLSTKDGRSLWNFKTQNRILGTASVEKNVVVFGSTDNTIYALDAKSGVLLWKHEASAPVIGSSTIYKGVAYIGASDHTFRALDLKTGKLLWQYDKVKGYIETRPLIYDNKVIFGAWDNNMYALDITSGSLAWKWNGDISRMHYSPAAVWPVASQGKVFFTAPDRVMTAVNAYTGSTVWRTKESMVRETIGISEDGRRLYSKTMQDSVVCYSTISNDPERLWITNVGYGYDHAASMPVEKDGIVFGSTKNGIIFAIDGLSGKLLWKHKVGNSLVGTVYPVSRNECVYTNGEGMVGLLKYTPKKE